LAFCNKCGAQIGDEEQFCPKCVPVDSSPKIVKDDRGETIDIKDIQKDYILDDRFKIDKLIGIGGFAAVYRATDIQLDEIRALKVFFDLKEDDDEALNELLQEAEKLEKVTENGIVHYFDLCLKSQIKYAVLEYIDGGNLEQYISGQSDAKLSEKDAIRIAKQIAIILKAAHSEGFHHKDLKSCNIMMTGSGDIKIMDFGVNEVFRTFKDIQPINVSPVDTSSISKSNSDISEAIQTKKIDYSKIVLPSSGGVVILDSDAGESLQTNRSRMEEAHKASSAAYMAPEQIMGRYAGSEADIWSFGVILFQMLTGNICFSGTHRDDVLASIKRKLHVEREGITNRLKQYGYMEKVEYVSSRINDLINNCIRFDYKIRPRNFELILNHLTVKNTTDQIEIIDGPLPGLKFAAIPGGTFTMGAPKDEAGSYDGERPQHQVTVKPFHMQTTPVTQAMWERVMGKNPADTKGSARPVESVSWWDILQFLKRLNLPNPDRNYRLPSEAEWEYACRAGTSSRFYSGDDDSDLDQVGWHDDNSFGQTHRVGQLKPNSWGLYDMHGNVWEWCSDIWQDNYNGAPTDGSAWTEDGDSHSRVLRGGSWHSVPDFCRSAYRSRRRVSGRGDSIGFRLAFS